MTLRFHVQPRNGTPRRGIAATFDGKEIFGSLINTDDGWARKCFVRDALKRLPKMSPVPSDGDIAGWNAADGGPAVTDFDEDRLADEIQREADRVDAAEIEKFGDGLPVFQRITCPELDAAEYAIEYLARWILTAGQPCIFAGGKKTLKTSLLVALAIALATGLPFLDQFEVPRAVRVLMMSGESGLATIQETARRVAASMGLALAEVENLIFSPDLPRFGDTLHCQALEKMLTEDEIEVLIVDPAFLCMPTEGAESSLFAMGELLRGISEACQRCGVTLILAHHCKKTLTDPYAPPELESIAFAGFQEFTRQWILVGRRERYEPGSGEHRLWLNCGGSAGHSSCHALNVSEGRFDGATPRHWAVEIMQAEEARQDVDERKKAREQAKRDEQLEDDKRAILTAAAKFPNGETLTAIRDAADVRNPRLGRAIAALVSDGDLIPIEITKGNNRSYEGYRLGGGE